MHVCILDKNKGRETDFHTQKRAGERGASETHIIFENVGNTTRTLCRELDSCHDEVHFTIE